MSLRTVLSSAGARTAFTSSVITLWTASLGSAAAATFTVSPTDTYKTVNSAILAATSGDTILVGPGTYATYIPDTKGKDLTISSTGGAGVTFLVGNGKQPVVTAKGGSVSFTGFTIQNPYVSATAKGGRGMVVSAGAAVTITDSVISSTGGTTVNGGGIYVAASSVTLVGNTFTTNQGANGAHLAAVSGSTVTATNNTFTAGTASDKGGAMSIDNTTVTLSGNTFSSNVAARWGGALRLTQGSDVSVDGDTFTANVSTAEQGGAISSAGNCALSIVGATFDSNTSVNGGGAIYLEEGPLSVSTSTFTGNASSVGSGGALLVLERTTPTDYGVTSVSVSESTFDANTTPGNGGALSVTDVSPQIALSTFTNNEGAYGGAIYAVDAVGNGGGFELDESVLDTNTATSSGGAVYVSSLNGIIVEHNAFAANHADTSGAAVYLDCNYSGVIGNNLIVYQTGAVDVFTSGSTCDIMDVAYNGFFGSGVGKASGLVNDADLPADGNLEVDPLLVNYTGNPATNNLQLQATSPLLEGASPWVLDALGTRGDIGVWP
jgi:predicted outer membrane repeat protein